MTRIGRLLWLLALVAILPRPALAGGELTLQDADAAYRAKNYKRACALYRRLTRTRPQDGEVWSSLALCLHRLDSDRYRDEAVKAAHRAIQLGDETVRKSAYYNLSLLGERIDLTPSNPCALLSELLESDACPDRKLYVCRYKVYNGGNGGGDTEDYLSFGPPLPDGGTPVPDRWEEFSEQWTPNALNLAIDRDFFISSRACSDWGWCPKRGELPEAVQRYYDRTEDQCLKAGRDASDCDLAVCEAFRDPGQDAPPALRDYLQQRENEREDCLEQNQKSEREEADKPAEYENCKFVFADPCRGLFGVVCADPENKTRVEELSLPRER